MPTYHVKWEIDIDAENADEAARKALAIQRDPNSIATVFAVTREFDGGRFMGVTIDLLARDALCRDGSPIAHGMPRLSGACFANSV
jgi:hypothetical protein